MVDLVEWIGSHSLSHNMEPNTVPKAVGIHYFQGLCARLQGYRQAVLIYGAAQEPAIYIPEQRPLPVAVSGPQDDFLLLTVEIPADLQAGLWRWI